MDIDLPARKLYLSTYMLNPEQGYPKNLLRTLEQNLDNAKR
jgi:hypothetical protein